MAFGALILGSIFGIITGITPGLHPNTILAFLLPVLMLSPVDGTLLFLVAFGVVHSLLDVIPSVFVGAPDPGNALSALPAHRLYLEGRGFEAIGASVIGSVISILFAILLLPVVGVIFPRIYFAVYAYLGWILLFGLVLLLLFSKHPFHAFLFVLGSGVFGIVTLPFGSGMLFPVFAGFFSVPHLITSFSRTKKAPKQRGTVRCSIPSLSVAFAGLGGALAGLLPGFGSSQIAVFFTKFRSLGKRGFLGAVNGLNSVDVLFSFLALWLIGNPRSGLAVAFQSVSDGIPVYFLVLVVGSTLFAVGLGLLFVVRFSGRIGMFVGAHQGTISRTLLVLFFLASFAFVGVVGIFALLVAAAFSWLAEKGGVPRAYAMAYLIIPTILFFIGG